MSTACPPEDELVRMVEGALGEVSLAAIESHVDTCEQCAAVIAGLGALDSAAAQPRLVGRYELDRRIGGGGMGEVWAAWDPQLRRDIAVKLVKPERADDDRERERLKREARALARLGHPNVLAVYDVGDTGDEVFIATELVIGDTLASRGGANADWRALVRLYAQAARGLAAAHAAGLVHRDIKPANLLIGTDGRVRVADFGLAVRSATPSPVAPTELAARDSGHVQITQTGYIAGTPAYMAPEQRLGEPADARADQYALCIALVEGIAGRRPPLDIGHDAMITFVEERRPREPDLDRLCGVMARGLSIDREDRFPHMDALADALDACVALTADVQPLAPPPLREPVQAPPPGRRGMLVAVVGGAALAGVAAVLIVSRVMSRDEVAHGPARTTAFDAPGQVAIVDAAATAPVAIVDVDAVPTTPGPGVELPGPGSQASLKPRPILGVPASTSPTASGSAASSGSAVSNGSTGSAASNGSAGSTGSAGSAGSTVADSQQLELGLASARRAMNKRDGKACLAALDALPTPVPMMTSYTVDYVRGQCEMLAGDCERGTKRVDAALDGMGAPPGAESLALYLCPITGPYKVRLARLLAQANNVKGAALCRTYVQPARTLAAEATVPHEKAGVAGAVRQLARCIGDGGDCAEAESLWMFAKSIDHSQLPWDLEKCAMPASAAPPPDPRIAMKAFNDKLMATQQALTRRDAKACKDYLAMPARDVPEGMQPSFEMIAGFCTMMLGDCKGGSARAVNALGANAANASTLEDTYCPIAGTLPQRLARMQAQLGAFADKRIAAPRTEWCSYMLASAKTAAGEAQASNPDDQARAAKVLQHLAWCLSTAGRCGEAGELVSLSIATDPNAHPSPTLSAKCP